MIVVTKNPGKYKIERKDGKGNVVETKWANTKWRAAEVAESMKTRRDEQIQGTGGE